MEDRWYWITSIQAADACGGHMAGLLAGLRTAFPQMATVQLSARKGSGDCAEDVGAAIGGYTEWASADTFVELIRNSAATLQTIHIEANDPRLTVGCVDRTGVVGRTALAGAPFPNLRRLVLARAYPFAGDIVFRGNYDRLEHLWPLSARGQMLRWLPLGLPPAAALVPDRSLDKLRYLRVADLPLTVPDVLHLLRRLSTRAQPVADLVARHYPLALRLRHVVFGMGACASIEHSAHHALLLAGVCPAVTCVRWPHTAADFADHCAALMDTDDYAPHADRLQLVDWEKKR
ncbi:hypothetical protein IWQ57_002010 [Coemansia nantahalensis]|uniref:Uncharacterized protein n=1 Tax=Coemansia nantahalensis TaxID=2789366 RepID=A0ACC1K278_9FUNG|nr:hypothetical protein IWQ57_002010 [Coemansia nantahalensis]